MNKLSYSLGLGIGQQLLQMGIEGFHIDDFAAAVKDVLEGKEPQIGHREAQAIVQAFFQKQEEVLNKEREVKGKAAKEEGEKFLAEMARKVIYIPVYKKVDAEAMPQQLFPDSPNIEVRMCRPVSIARKDSGMVLETDDGEIQTDGIFLLRESVAPDKLVPGLELDGNHVKVDRRMATNLPGLFAAGDITGTPYQYVKAAGEGNVAALSAVSYIDGAK